MSTITEDINKVIQIKNDLNSILLENGLDGGRVFEDYPEKFRELFRILQDQTEEVVDEYTGPNEIETFVAKPEISWFENVVTITCATQGVTIYYMVKSKSGNYDKGYGPYMNKFYIKEDVYVEAFARYNGVDSTVSSVNIPFYKGQVPDNPVIVRDGTTVTITCTGTYTSIWWSTVNGNYVQYTGPVTVQRTQDVYAYSTYNRFASDIVKDEAPEQIIIPEVPTIDCTLNIITMETETENATIWYMIRGDDEWIEYEGEIEIFESGWYRAKAVLNGIESFATNYVWCEFIAAPAEPDITCSNNTVTIEAEEGAVIYYRFEGDEDWILYDEPFVISETTTVEAYCHKDGLDSDEVSVECEYVAPEIGTVGACSISNNNNLITIACSQTPDATIYYCVSPTELENMYDLSQYSIYEGPFYITEDCYIYAHAERPPYTANSWTQAHFTYTEPVEPPSDRLPVPVISCNNNVVSIATSVEGGAIYYKRLNDSEYHLYTKEIPITETTTFLAFVSKDDKTSDIVSQQCIYVAPTVVKPARPSITCEDNLVTMKTTTSGAVIYYKIYGEANWHIYSGPFYISATTTFQAYSYKNEVPSDITSKTCEYVSFIISDYQYEYLTLDILEDGKVGFGGTKYNSSIVPDYTIYYNINDAGWESIQPYNCNQTEADKVQSGDVDIFLYTNKIDVSAGDKVKIKANIPAWGPISLVGAHGIKILTNCYFNIYGNINSLIAGDDFLDYNTKYYENVNAGIGALGSVFRYNKKLLSVKNLVLPNTNISKGCYGEMFGNCTGLVYPPEKLPATKLQQMCYLGMFSGCFSLVESPILPAHNLVKQCYMEMFYGCNSLSTIKCYAMTNIYAKSDVDNTTWNWTRFAPQTGKFYKTEGISWPSGVNGIPTGWTVYTE